MRWLLPVVLVAMIATAAGALAARDVYTEPDRSVAVAPSQGQVPPGEQPGDTKVTATKDAGDHPLYGTVRELLQTLFDAINARRYDQWRTVVTRNRVQREPETRWRENYRTTRDGTIVVHRIELGPEDTARVLLSFTSVQDPQLAPPELPEPCIRWRVVWPLVVENGAWKLDVGITNTAPQHDAC
jgi:hypothetical protein